MTQPVVSDPARTHAIDRTQLKTLGMLGIPYGGFMVLLAAIPNPLTGRLAFVFSGGAILLISLHPVPGRPAHAAPDAARRPRLAGAAGPADAVISRVQA